MTQSSLQTPPSAYVERFAWWVAATLASIFLTCVHLILAKPYVLTSFERLVHFQAVEPFQHRILVPALVAGAEHVLPLGHRLLFGAVEVLFWLLLIGVGHQAVKQMPIGHNSTLHRALAFTLLLPMALTLMMPDLRMVPGLSITHGVIDLGDWWALTVYYYPYDLPAGVFTLALALLLFALAERPTLPRLLMFFALFALATSNRETTLLLIPMTALLFWGRVSTTQWLALLAAQAAVYYAVEWPLHWLFSDQPNPHRALSSTQYEDHLASNLALFESPIYALTFMVRFAGGCLLPVLLWWRYLDRRTVSALLGFVLPLVLSAIVVGRIPEHRIFTEAVPLIWLAALQVVAARVAVDDQTDSKRPDI